MKKWLIPILFVLLLDMRAYGADAAPETSAAAMVLVHPASGTVLAAGNAADPRLIASTTKLMTALVSVQTLSPDKTVEIREEWTRIEGSSMYLRPGEKCTVRELLEGLLLASGNDAALALAVTAAGDEESFAERMNAEAEKLGLDNTHFENPHGLDGKRHYSCAADLAKIMAAALRDDTLRGILGERTCSIRGRVYENHNKLLRTCPGVFAGKTGYTMAAGRCLVSACERGGMELVCVTLSDPHDWEDHAALYDWAYMRFGEFTLSAGETAAELPIISGAADTVPLAVECTLSVCVPRNAEVSVVCSLPPFVFAPVYAGARAGTMTVYADGTELASAGLVFARDSRRVGMDTGFRDVADRLMGVYRIQP